jgi:hypothetical protein
MTARAPRFPFALDPLIAEAKRRMRRRRFLLVVLIVALGGLAFALSVDLLPGGPKTTGPPEGVVQQHVYTGHLYSLSAVTKAFNQLGLELRGERTQADGASFQLWQTVSGAAPSRDGTLVVTMRRSAAGDSMSVPGRELKFANVSVFTRSSDLDEIRGALSALRWGTLAQGKPASHLIVPGESIGPIWLGESRKAIERAVGPGTPLHGPLEVSYLRGHIVVDYVFHDTPTHFAESLATRWSGYRTSSGVGVGSPRKDMRRIYATCEGKTDCYLLQGPWADALATLFAMRNGRITGIGIGYS